jgi:hypothetical protein
MKKCARNFAKPGEAEMSTPSLDHRVADALAADKHDAGTLAALIKEATSTLASIEAEQEHAAKQSLDPAVHDFAEQKQRADRAGLMASRLRNAMPRLQALLDAEVKAAKLAAWNADLDALKEIRDGVARKFRDRYAACASEIIGLFSVVADVDKQIEALNDRAYEAGGASRMRTTEATARGVDHINGNTRSIMDMVRLPMFGIGSGEVPFAWPKPTTPIGLALMAAMPSPAQPDPQLLQEVAEAGGFEAGGLRKVLERRRQEEADQWERRGREQERQREAAAAEEAQRLREAAVERRRQGA